MSILDDVSQLSKIGMFVLLFIICIAIFTVFIEELGVMESDLGIPSHSSEYSNLNFTLGFTILLSIGGMVLILFLNKRKSKYDKFIDNEQRFFDRMYRRH